MVGVSGFALGLGGLLTLPVTIPIDVGTAHLCGHDVDSDAVRSVILLSLLGASGAAVVSGMGIQLGEKAAMAALKVLPGRVLIEINKKVGFRLLTKFGQSAT